jgi:hypothetical protein
MDNPYQSPSDENITCPQVEVVLRRHWVGRKSQQIYRFNSPLGDQEVVKETIICFFLRQKTRLLSWSDSSLEFERLGTSPIYQLIIPSEKFTPHKIQVPYTKTSSGTLITCNYQICGILPNLMIPPYPLEEEVRLLAFECGVR